MNASTTITAAPRVQSINANYHPAEKEPDDGPDNEPDHSRASDNKGEPYGWILSPQIDILFCCGGLVWILFLAHYFFVGPDNANLEARAFLTVGALGAIFLGETHTIATLVRVYSQESVRSRFSFYTRWAAIALSTLALAGCLNKDLPPILAKIYLLIVSQHFTKQAYGIALLYCLKRKFTMNSLDRRLLAFLLQSTMIFAILRQFTYPAWSGDSFLGQKIPFWGPLPEWIFFVSAASVALSSLLFLALLLSRLMIKKEVFPLPALMLTLSAVLIFVLGKEMTGTLWIYVPAFFHGSQYLAVTTSVYLKEQGLAATVAAEQIGSLVLHGKTLRYFGFLTLSGVAVFIGFPRILEQFGINYAMAVASIFTTVQFHHVLVDHAIWRLKEPCMRELLVR